jgi:predicted DNA-binding protein (MmcQ/YjbR family)
MAKYDSQLKADKAYNKRLKDKGYKQVSLKMSPDIINKINDIKRINPSFILSALIREAIEQEHERINNQRVS